MRRVEAIVAAALATSLAGCVLRGTPKTTATAPPAPQPAAAAPAPAPQPPPKLSMPQTQVQLPPPQPVDPEAVPPVQQPEPAPETTPASASGGRSGRSNRVGPPAIAGNTAPRPETTAPAPAPPATPVAPVVESRPPIQEAVPASEQKRLQDSAQARRKEILQWLETTGKKRMSRHDQTTAARIRAFLKDSDEAEKRGDMRQADALAERAQILLRELQNGR